MNIEKIIEEKARECVALTAINEICQYAYEGTITNDEVMEIGNNLLETTYKMLVSVIKASPELIK